MSGDEYRIQQLRKRRQEALSVAKDCGAQIAAIRRAESRQAKHNAKTRKARRQSGLCAFCGRPSETYRCRESCWPKYVEAQRKRRTWQRQLAEQATEADRITTL